MPLHVPALLARRHPGLARATAVAAATCATAGALAIAIGEEQPAAQIRMIAALSQPADPRYFDLEANKATSMRALGHHMAGQQARPASGYQDLEANRVRSQRAH